MELIAEKPHKKRQQIQIPLEKLVYETIDGIPYYYKGYKEVLAGKKSITEIMACSDLQGIIIALLNYYIGLQINRKKYLLATNESGLHLTKNDNLGVDLGIFEREKLGKLKGKFFEVAPKIAIEVDIKVEIDLAVFPSGEIDYLVDKANKMIEFGTEKVVWLATKSRKIFIAEKTGDWRIVDWASDIHLLDDVKINIKQMLDEEEINY